MSDQSIYFARCLTAKGADMGAIKIGCTYYLRERLNAIAGNAPFVCELITFCPGTMFEEDVAHMWLKPHRIAGEYYHDTPEVMEFVAEVARTGRFPVRLSIASEHPFPTFAEGQNFMERHGLSAADLAEAAGLRSPTTYENLIKSGAKPNRRFIAALMVAALRKGHDVDWHADLKPFQAVAA